MANTCRAKRALVALVCAALLSGPATVTAAPITWEWLGSIASSTIPGIAVNSDASLRITFESTSPDLDPSPTCGIYYPAIVSATADFGVWRIRILQAAQSRCSRAATSGAARPR
jgi:hypothetical protein